MTAAQRDVRALAAALAGDTPPNALVTPAAEPAAPARAPRLAERRASSLVLADAATLAAEHPALAAATAPPPHTVVVLTPEDVTQGADDGAEGAAAAVSETGVPDAARAVPASYGDIWLRDTGPMFVAASDGPRAVAFRFNGWGGRYVYRDDAGVAERLARLADAPLDRLPLVGEPGAVEFDGEDTAIASRRCLLNKNRNPDLNARDVERLLRAALGVERVIWIEESLAGDHTDGHTDTLVRFARPGLVVTEAPAGARDPNSAARDHVARALDRARDAQGRRLDVARIAGAPVLTDAKGWPLPATHLNYVFAPKRLIAPLYSDPRASAQALAGLADIFPDRDIVGLSAQAVLTGGGAFHCCTCAAPSDAALRDAAAEAAA